VRTSRSITSQKVSGTSFDFPLAQLRQPTTLVLTLAAHADSSCDEYRPPAPGPIAPCGHAGDRWSIGCLCQGEQTEVQFPKKRQQKILVAPRNSNHPIHVQQFRKRSGGFPRHSPDTPPPDQIKPYTDSCGGDPEPRTVRGLFLDGGGFLPVPIRELACVSCYFASISNPIARERIRLAGRKFTFEKMHSV
jgi:hypothetical protein